MITLLFEKSFIKNSHLYLQKTKPQIKLLEISHAVLSTHAPLKHKSVRANQAPFMNKELQEEIMNRPKLRNQFLKGKPIEDKHETHNATNA